MLNDDKLQKTFKIYMKKGISSRRQMSQVQNSIEILEKIDEDC